MRDLIETISILISIGIVVGPISGICFIYAPYGSQRKRGAADDMAIIWILKMI